MIFAKVDPACPASKSLTRLKHAIATVLREHIPLEIYVGYVSEESLQWLLEFGPPAQGTKLYVGMAAEGVTSAQYELLSKLCLSGWEVRMATVKNHSKIYARRDQEWAVIGSTNLQSLLVPEPLELDVALASEDYKKLLPLLNSWWSRATPFLAWGKKLKSPLAEPLLTGEVATTPAGLYVQTANRVALRVKMEPASNFNACFAKPKHQNGQRRNWYEIEVNVPSKSAAHTALPIGVPFTVVTDDGFKFQCLRNGTNGKNLQSTPNLQILGKWLKGRLLEATSLKYGEPGTESILDQFGSNQLTFTELTTANHWLISFGAL